ncbi:hypothetical protein [Gimesia alba]|uniref:hypothetical protein n=1 Tax=Gimesia alba TaxID=2527973 RepID=UPI0018D85291|nr:hypothetical protein [Gimesia alba]
MLTLRLTGGEAQPWHRVIVFQNIGAEAIQASKFKLPDEAVQMPGARLTFQDITLRPGHVAFVWQGHEFVMMSNWLRVDGKEYGWDEQEVIMLVD